MIEKLTYDEPEDKLIVTTLYDSSSVIADNLSDQHEAQELGRGRYKGNMVKVGSVHMGDIIRLRNIGYDILSGNPDESRRALVYIQENEPHLLSVPGKPFARQRKKWA